MSVYQELCDGGESTAPNTGLKNQNCTETKLDIPILSNGFEFASVADFKTVASWMAAKAAKSIVPLYPAYELADASTEDTKFETGNFSKVTAKGVEKIVYENYVSLQAYDILKSYEENESYRYLFEFNEGEDYSGVFASDGVKVKGRKIKSFTVTRTRATKDKIPFVKVEITFDDKDDIRNAVVVESDLSKEDLEGIYGVDGTVSGSPTSSEIVVEAKFSGSTINAETIALADWNYTGGTITASVFANGKYTLSGTGLTSGTLSTGVIEQSNMMLQFSDLAVTI
jgi:hypothetical protein